MLLRYWETEFQQLRPRKTARATAPYRDKDIDIILYIKYLLYEEQYTIPGAKKKLLETKDDLHQTQLALAIPAKTGDTTAIAQELRDILQFLKAELFSL